MRILQRTRLLSCGCKTSCPNYVRVVTLLLL